MAAAFSSDLDRVRRVAEALAEARLEAVVVGCTAAIFHMAPLLTLDLDLLVRDTPLNRKKLRRVAEILKVPPPLQLSEVSDVVHLEPGPIPVDFIFDELPGGLSFASVRSRAERFSLGNVSVWLASLDDVIASKRAADRPKDRYHLEIIRQLLIVREAFDEWLATDPPEMREPPLPATADEAATAAAPPRRPRPRRRAPAAAPRRPRASTASRGRPAPPRRPRRRASAPR
jgi:hypothetical protein